MGSDQRPLWGRISAMAFDNNHLVAGTEGGGVFLSTDNGTSWRGVNSGLTDLDITSLALIGTNILAGTKSSGVFRSTDNGASWVPANSGLPFDSTDSLYPAITCFAVNSTNLFAGTSGGVFRSTDNGTGWS